jgi:hypothetical protein
LLVLIRKSRNLLKILYTRAIHDRVYWSAVHG